MKRLLVLTGANEGKSGACSQRQIARRPADEYRVFARCPLPGVFLLTKRCHGQGLEGNSDDFLLARIQCHSLPSGESAEMFLASPRQFDIDFRNLRSCKATGIFNRESYGFRRSVDLQSAVMKSRV